MVVRLCAATLAVQFSDQRSIGIGGCGFARRTASAYTSVGLAKKQSAKLIVLNLSIRDGFMHVVVIPKSKSPRVLDKVHVKTRVPLG